MCRRQSALMHRPSGASSRFMLSLAALASSALCLPLPSGSQPKKDRRSRLAPAALKIQCPHDQRPDLREVTHKSCDGTHRVFLAGSQVSRGILLDFQSIILRHRD